jgi:hypothetical protein
MRIGPHDARQPVAFPPAFARPYDAIDLLEAQGEITVDVETLGYRRAFIGAVLMKSSTDPGLWVASFSFRRGPSRGKRSWTYEPSRWRAPLGRRAAARLVKPGRGGGVCPCALPPAWQARLKRRRLRLGFSRLLGGPGESGAVSALATR